MLLRHLLLISMPQPDMPKRREGAKRIGLL
jgi:hypothetical protein